jgi:hypothetical protein
MMSAWQEAGSWLKQNWLALVSFVISVFAVVLSYKKFTYDTRPMLILRAASEGNEIENVGHAVAVNIMLTLIERVKRPSGTLSVPHTLRPGEKAIIGAFDWPKALTVGLNHADNTRKETIHSSCLLETFVNYLTPCQPNAGTG